MTRDLSSPHPAATRFPGPAAGNPTADPSIGPAPDPLPPPPDPGPPDTAARDRETRAPRPKDERGHAPARPSDVVTTPGEVIAAFGRRS